MAVDALCFILTMRQNKATSANECRGRSHPTWSACSPTTRRFSTSCLPSTETAGQVESALRQEGYQTETRSFAGLPCVSAVGGASDDESNPLSKKPAPRQSRRINKMMRILVACPSCKRQYDATGSDTGDRFHCLCGEALTVRQPKSHEAAVVRCSSCGSTRQVDSTSCGHCGSKFTLHERDLNTICPTCAARVSDRASYCHHCATRLDPQDKAGEPTSQSCPACGEGHHLTSRDFGVADLSILECPVCAGLWLGHNAFRHLVERSKAAAATSKVHAMAAARAATTEPSPSRVPRQAGPFYRTCPECPGLMQRRNYDEKSGVVIDVCGSHGVWFDDNELAAILRWIRDGRSRLARDHTEELRRERARTASPTTVAGTFPPFAKPPGGDVAEPWTLLEFLLEIGIFIFRVLR